MYVCVYIYRCMSNQALFVLLVITTCCAALGMKGALSKGEATSWAVWDSPPLHFAPPGSGCTKLTRRGCPGGTGRLSGCPFCGTLSFLLFLAIIRFKGRNKKQVYAVTGII